MATGWKAHTLQYLGQGSLPYSALDVFNGSSNRVLRVYRVCVFTALHSFSVGGMVNFGLYRTSQAFGYIAPTGSRVMVSVSPYDRSSEAVLDPSITVGAGRTTVVSASIRNYQFIHAAATGRGVLLGLGGNATLTMTVPFAEVWRSEYDDPNLQPLVARPGQGYDLRQITSPSFVADADVEMEFTDEAL